MEFLGVRFEVWGEGAVKLLESKYISTHTHVISGNIPFSTKTFLIFLMSGVFCKKSAFFEKNSTFTQSISMRAVSEIF